MLILWQYWMSTWRHTWLQVEGSESGFLSIEPEETYVD